VRARRDSARFKTIRDRIVRAKGFRALQDNQDLNRARAKGFRPLQDDQDLNRARAKGFRPLQGDQELDRRETEDGPDPGATVRDRIVGTPELE